MMATSIYPAARCIPGALWQNGAGICLKREMEQGILSSHIPTIPPVSQNSATGQFQSWKRSMMQRYPMRLNLRICRMESGLVIQWTSWTMQENYICRHVSWSWSLQLRTMNIPLRLEITRQNQAVYQIKWWNWLLSSKNWHRTGRFIPGLFLAIQKQAAEFHLTQVGKNIWALPITRRQNSLRWQTQAFTVG